MFERLAQFGRTFMIFAVIALSAGIFGFSAERAGAADDSSQLEYAVTIGPIIGSTSANYVYGSFFNPAGSGKTALVRRIRIDADTKGAATYQNLTVRRITAASAGTQLSGVNIPKKNTGSSDSIMEIRYANVTATFAGVTDSRLMYVVGPAAAGAFYAEKDVKFGANENLIIRPGEGIALYQEAAGDTDQIVRLQLEWEEQVSAPAAQNEYLFSFPRVAVAAAANYAYNSFFNPVGSGKTASISRLSIDVDCDGAGRYTNNIAIRRTTAASGGTQIAASNVPPKNTATATSAMQFRHTGPTVTLAGSVDSRLMMITPCGTNNESNGHKEILFDGNDEKLIIQPGEGLALYSEAAGDANQLARMMIDWQETVSTPASQGEYLISYPRVEAAAAANYVYHSFFNPAASGKNAVIKRIEQRVDNDGVGTYQQIAVRRITAASGGTQIAVANVPKKHTGTGNTVMDLRYGGPTVTASGYNMLGITGSGAVGQMHARNELVFGGNENLVLKPGEGISMYSVAAGDADQYVKISIEWDEEASAPVSEDEYLIAVSMSGNATSGYNFTSFFNPAASGKTVVMKRMKLFVDAAGAANYVPFTVRRITAASGGTLTTSVSGTSKKNTSAPTSIAEIRYANPTVTLVGSADSRIAGAQSPGAAGSRYSAQLSGHNEKYFENEEFLILQPGEGLVLYQEAVGDTDHRINMTFEWQEQSSTPGAQANYMISAGPVAGSIAAGYVYETFFNPASSEKRLVFSRVELSGTMTGAAGGTSYQPISVRRITAASGGTLISGADIPVKHTNTASSIAEVRYGGITTTMSGSADSRVWNGTQPGGVGQNSGEYEYVFTNLDELVLQPGEGIAFYQETAVGGTNMVYRMNAIWQEISIGTLSVDIVDSSGVSVSSPAVSMDSASLGFACQSTGATFGVAAQKIRVTNGSSNPNWNLTVAASGGATALWAGSGSYDFNDASGSPAGCSDGADADAFAGQLSMNPALATITPQSGCDTTGLSLGASSAYSEGVTNSLTLLSAGSGASTGCYWDLTGITVGQTIPAEQATGIYNITLTLTVTAL